MRYIFVVLVWGVALHICNAQSNADYPDSLNKKRLYTTVAVAGAGYGAGLYFLGDVWYKDQQRVQRKVKRILLKQLHQWFCKGVFL